MKLKQCATKIWTGFSVKDAMITVEEIKAAEKLSRLPRLNIRTHDIHGNPLEFTPLGLFVCDPNNWLRRIFYALNVRRSWIRAV